MPEPSLSCSPVDGAHLGLAAGRRRPPQPSRPRRPRGNAWEPLTEHASRRTSRGEEAALQPWLSGRGSEASAGLSLHSFRRLVGYHGLQRPGFCGPGGTGVCSERRAPDGPALRGAQELGCVRSRERSARGRGGSRWPGALLPQPEPARPPTARAGSGVCSREAVSRAGGRGCLSGAHQPRRGGVSPINALGNARRRQRGLNGLGVGKSGRGRGWGGGKESLGIPQGGAEGAWGLARVIDGVMGTGSFTAAHPPCLSPMPVPALRDAIASK